MYCTTPLYLYRQQIIQTIFIDYPIYNQPVGRQASMSKSREIKFVILLHMNG